KQFIEIIHDESTKLSNLVDDMITSSRLNEHGSLNIELVNIFKLVKDTLQLFSHEIEKKRLNVRIEIDEELSLYCDKLKLKHIITNLIQNAIRYNLENGEIKIKVQNDKKMSGSLLSVIQVLVYRMKIKKGSLRDFIV